MCNGLYSPDGNPVNIPLQDISIHGDIIGFCGEITIEQRYLNNTKKDLEIIYIFPVPDRAVVSSFSAQIGAKTIQGEIRAKEEAFKVYDQAINDGNSAFLLEQFRPNIFQLSLGRVIPGEEVKIKVIYLETAQYQDGEIRISIPTLVAPRYIPGIKKKEKQGMGTAEPTDKVPDADFITPPVDQAAKYTFELQLKIRPLIPIAEFTSPSHRLNICQQPGGSTLITLTEGSALLDRDLIILGRCQDGEEIVSSGVCWQDPQRGEGYLYLNLLPDLPYQEEHQPINYLFLIDISGSMGGVKLQQAKNALKLCLRNMEEGDTFNILAFESDCHYYSVRGSVSFNQDSLNSAGRWIDELGAMGGTEIEEALQFALNSSDERESVILLFTDGEVGNDAEMIKLVRRRIKGNRLFSFGIDTAVNSYFINKLAEAGGGLPEFIYPGERIEDKVIRQFSRITSPTLRDVTVQWEGLANKEVYPEQITALFNQEPLAFIAQYKGQLTGKVSVAGWLNNKELRFEMDLSSLEAQQDSSFLRKHWAKMKIEHLEKSMEDINPRRKQSLIDEIIRVSQEYGLVSSQTSFVAVHERLDKETGIPETVVVPVAPAAQWEMLLPAPPLMEGGFDVAYSMQMNIKSGFLPARAKPSLSSIPANMDMMTFEEDSFHSAPSENYPLEEAIRTLAMLQQADGSFPGEEEAKNVEVSTYENTALATLGILLSAGNNFSIYRRQIEKAVNYLLKHRQMKELKEMQIILAAYACKTYLSMANSNKRLSKAVIKELNSMGMVAGAQLTLEKDPEKMATEVLAITGHTARHAPALSHSSSVRELAILILQQHSGLTKK